LAAAATRILNLAGQMMQAGESGCSIKESRHLGDDWDKNLYSRK
jgi:hypothetical protein